MTTSTAARSSTGLLDALTLKNMQLEELHEKAKALNIAVNGLDRSELIEAIITAAAERGDEVEPGMLFSLHSRTDAAKEIIKSARNIIVQNEMGGTRFKLFLKNQQGSLYSSTTTGCKITNPANLARIMDAISALPDGSQEQTLRDFQETPDLFETPLLVLQSRRQEDDTYRSFVMLYLKKKTVIPEQSF
jgi:hypothetical protein